MKLVTPAPAGGGDTECYEVSSSEAPTAEVEHLEEPMKGQTDAGSFFKMYLIHMINVGLAVF